MYAYILETAYILPTYIYIFGVTNLHQSDTNTLVWSRRIPFAVNRLAVNESEGVALTDVINCCFRALWPPLITQCVIAVTARQRFRMGGAAL